MTRSHFCIARGQVYIVFDIFVAAIGSPDAGFTGTWPDDGVSGVSALGSILMPVSFAGWFVNEFGIYVLLDVLGVGFPTVAYAQMGVYLFIGSVYYYSVLLIKGRLSCVL